VDHLLDVPVFMHKTGARLIGSRTAVELLARAGVPASRCHAVTGGDVIQAGPWRIRTFTVSHDRLFSIVPFSGEVRGSRYVFPSHQDNFFRPLSAGFQFGPLSDFTRVHRDFERENHGRLILLDYFRPWTLN
jgi:hypothetical protein